MAAGALLVQYWSFREMYPVVGAGCLIAAGYLLVTGPRTHS